MRILFTLFLLFFIGYADVIKSKDRLGREVERPPVMERIAITCYGGAVHEIVLFLGEDKIVAHPGAQRFVFFEKLYPKLTKVQSIGTFNDVNLETLLKVKPDIVFAGITAQATNKRIEDLGIPVFTLGTGVHTLETLLNEFTQVGILVGEEEKAKRLVSYWNETIETLKKTFPKSEKRVKVLYANGSGKISSEIKGRWGDSFIKSAGGVNVVEDFPLEGDISAEMLLKLNPDVLILSKNMSQQVTPELIKTNPMYKNLKAVKNNQVYVAPIGGFWWDRPSPEAILGIIWLNKILYPEQTKDIDLFTQTQIFFKEFYNYELKKEEYETFFTSSKELR